MLGTYSLLWISNLLLNSIWYLPRKRQTPKSEIVFLTILTMHREYLKCDRSKKESYWCNGFMHFTKILGLFLILSSNNKSVWLNSAVIFFALVAQRIWIAILVEIPPPPLAAAIRVLYAFLKCILADLFCVCFRSLIGQISYWFIIVLVLEVDFSYTIVSWSNITYLCGWEKLPVSMSW